ncbi:helix-turn-helix domain-containing protein [Actinocorallia sp. A-T 12471]|uniref:PucR family transcriptional regulator n=1 Tax=Actinocorallia sp. A-T 12471 TaxID=3089813 RepID=UPI0029CCD5E2|nr:helix-turn-helix domain-containing protein [Actinocorallia sp. A-T 12471]MDX6743771.1 helix-turn-helix domain-containing protein [Actinocorallia sp. A-T 12471]
MSITLEGPSHRTFPQLPGDWNAFFTPFIGGVADQMIEEIKAGVPEFARMEPAYVTNIRTAVEGALQHFVQLITDPDASLDKLTEVFRYIGWGEARVGRSLDDLQVAMRIGARVALRRITVESERHDLPRSSLGELAEAILLFLDELAAAASAGYHTASEQVAGEQTRRRRRLLDMLLSDQTPSSSALADAARDAGWRLPKAVAAVALRERRTEDYLQPALPPDVLMDLNRHEPCLVVPDPDGPGRRQALEKALRDWSAAIGPTVEPADLGNSLRWAREVLALAHRGVVPDDGLIRCVDHLPSLVVFKDEDLVWTVARARLAPLLDIRARHRDRLARTLLACLQNGFNATEVAARLHVHPQTVRYRLHQLEELFGEQLYDPEARMAFEMSLRVWLTLHAEGRES